MVVAAYIAILGKKKLKVSETQDSQKSSEDNKLVTLEQKLDKLLDTVAVMEGRIDQQEQKSRLRELSPGLSAHSSLRIYTGYINMTIDPAVDALKSGPFQPGVHKVKRGHGGRVVTLSPPTSVAGVRSLSWP